MRLIVSCVFVLMIVFAGCNKSSDAAKPVVAPSNFNLTSYSVDGIVSPINVYNIAVSPVLKFQFSTAINRQTVSGNILLNDAVSGVSIACTVSYQNGDSIVLLQPSSALSFLNKYTASLATTLKSAAGGSLNAGNSISFITKIDSSDKFAQISDSALLDLVQKQTFKYFWDFGHPVCGMALERNNGDNNVVTSGGSGFGIMSMIVAANRGFITRSDATARINTILNFLATKCQRWHGAFSHWINGTTGATVAFGNNNGADIVETSYLLQGLLCARQYFNSGSDANEMKLRDSVNSIWNSVDWNWFTQNATQKSLYWQYNPSYTATADIWSIAVTGWNEALITYVLAASSTTHAITKDVYDNGWANNGAIKNGATYYSTVLPLGQAYGGPLFFAHYSFLGINPFGLSDAYANYQTQNTAQVQINYNYCVSDPKAYFGYSNECWGLTASDISGSYTASSPTNDQSYIAATAAISSMPYTPVQSMNALRFFYYKLGNKIWGNYGFVDAFSLNNLWFASSYLAIDQGPQIVMIENYRTGLLWNLFVSCPEIKTGMRILGFTAPYL